MSSDRLRLIEEKIDKLNIQKNLLVQKEKVRQRKLLNKQKIILGGFYINQLLKMSAHDRDEVYQKVMKTIPEYRKQDIKAINELFIGVQDESK